MARIKESVSSAYAQIDKEALKRPIIFVVDMINGFIREGALHDPAIQECVKPIGDLINRLDCRRIFVADAHPPKTREFQSYPKHCIIGTDESEIVAELQPYVEAVFHKNSTNAFLCEAFQAFLKNDSDRYDDVIITGCCSDICILQFALCFNAWLNEHNKEEKRIIVPIDCIDTYHMEKIHDVYECNAFALQNMSANGIQVVSKIKG